jgi:hypothetical protein
MLAVPFPKLRRLVDDPNLFRASLALHVAPNCLLDHLGAAIPSVLHHGFSVKGKGAWGAAGIV